MSKGTFKKAFTIPLSEGDLAERAKEQARLHDQREALKTDKRDALAGFKQKFSGVDDRLDELAKEIGTGQREIEVDCERRPHPTAPRWQLVRLDTHTIFGEEPMDIEELASQRTAGLPLHRDGEATSEGVETAANGDGNAVVATGENGAGDASDDQGEGAVVKGGNSDGNAHHAEGNGNGAAAAPAKKERAKPVCPRVIDANAIDPRLDRICGKEGSPRRKGFCAEDYEALGGKVGSKEMTDAIARRAQRQQLHDDEARAKRKATGQPELPAALPAHADGDDLDGASFEP